MCGNEYARRSRSHAAALTSVGAVSMTPGLPGRRRSYSGRLTTLASAGIAPADRPLAPAGHGFRQRLVSGSEPAGGTNGNHSHRCVKRTLTIQWGAPSSSSDHSDGSASRAFIAVYGRSCRPCPSDVASAEVLSMHGQHDASTPKSDQALLTIPDVARRLGLSPSTVRRLVRRGELPRIRVGRSVRFREADLTELIDSGRSSQEARDPAGGPGRAAADAGGRHGQG